MAGRALLAQGVKPGDRIFIMLPRVPAWYEAMLGAVRIGAVVMPGTNQLTARDIAYRIRAAGAAAAITSADGAAKIDAIDEELPSLRLRIAHERRRAAGLAGLGRDPRRGRRRRAARGAHRPRGSDDPVLHQRHRQLREDGPAQPGVRPRPRLHRPLLARPAPRRPPLDRDRHGLGEGRLGRPVRPVPRTRHQHPGGARQARRGHDPQHPARGPDQLVLRAADAVPAAGAGRPRRRTTSARCATARAPASR